MKIELNLDSLDKESQDALYESVSQIWAQDDFFEFDLDEEEEAIWKEIEKRASK